MPQLYSPTLILATGYIRPPIVFLNAIFTKWIGILKLLLYFTNNAFLAIVLTNKNMSRGWIFKELTELLATSGVRPATCVGKRNYSVNNANGVGGKRKYLHQEMHWNNELNVLNYREWTRTKFLCMLNGKIIGGGKNIREIRLRINCIFHPSGQNWEGSNIAHNILCLMLPDMQGLI